MMFTGWLVQEMLRKEAWVCLELRDSIVHFRSCRGQCHGQLGRVCVSWGNLLCLPVTCLKTQSFSLGLSTNVNTARVKRSIHLKVSYRFNTVLIKN